MSIAVVNVAIFIDAIIFVKFTVSQGSRVSAITFAWRLNEKIRAGGSLELAFAGRVCRFRALKSLEIPKSPVCFCGGAGFASHSPQSGEYHIPDLQPTQNASDINIFVSGTLREIRAPGNTPKGFKSLSRSKCGVPLSLAPRLCYASLVRDFERNHARRQCLSTLEKPKRAE